MLRLNDKRSVILFLDILDQLTWVGGVLEVLGVFSQPMKSAYAPVLLTNLSDGNVIIRADINGGNIYPTVVGFGQTVDLSAKGQRVISAVNLYFPVSVPGPTTEVYRFSVALVPI